MQNFKFEILILHSMYTVCIIYSMFVKMFIIIKLFVTIDQHQ